ncbi:MAG TPA: histidine phosphatase family protein [Steroidobacteraceae bacterium]
MRHAKPAAAWGEDPNPGLDPLGATQAVAAAQQLAKAMTRVAVYTSPLRRCRETAQPLCDLWQCAATLLPAVAEIPSPPLDAAARREWLTAGMRGTWRRLHDGAPPGSIDYLQWRRSVIDALLALPHDSVIFTHYIAINVAAGAAQQRDDVLCFKPDHASVTVLDTDSRRLRLVGLGREAQTAVLAR